MNLAPKQPIGLGSNLFRVDYAEGTPEDMMASMRCFQYSVASQYGTHVDVPRHFFGNDRPMNEITVQELVYPLVVIDQSAACAENLDFMLTVEDIKAWEAEYDTIPEGAFVAFRSDWHKIKKKIWIIQTKMVCLTIPAGISMLSNGW